MRTQSLRNPGCFGLLPSSCFVNREKNERKSIPFALLVIDRPDTIFTKLTCKSNSELYWSVRLHSQSLSGSPVSMSVCILLPHLSVCLSVYLSVCLSVCLSQSSCLAASHLRLGSLLRILVNPPPSDCFSPLSGRPICISLSCFYKPNSGWGLDSLSASLPNIQVI